MSLTFSILSSSHRQLPRIPEKSHRIIETVIVLAGIELIFILVAGVLQCFGFGMKLMLITYRYFDGETLEQVAQRGSGGPIPRNTQGQVGWSSE